MRFGQRVNSRERWTQSQKLSVSGRKRALVEVINRENGVAIGIAQNCSGFYLVNYKLLTRSL